MACTNRGKKGFKKPNCKKVSKGMYVNINLNILAYGGYYRIRTYPPSADI